MERTMGITPNHHVPIHVTVTFSLFLLSSSLLLQIKAESSIKNSPSKLVKCVCNHTRNYKFCVEALESDPRTATASDMLTISKIALELAMKNATGTRAYIDQMLKSNDTKLTLKPSLKSCDFWYERVIWSFKSAYGELQEDPMTANYDTLIAGDDAEYCEKAMARDGVCIESVSARNQITLNFSSIGNAVTDFLWRALSPPLPPRY